MEHIVEQKIGGKMRIELDNIKVTLPFLFINFNILNILDKTVTWLALKNPRIGELNPIVKSLIDSFGTDSAMVIYILIGFTIAFVAYKVVIAKRLYCEKNSVSPEAIFMGLNIIFYFVVINNISLVMSMQWNV